MADTYTLISSVTVGAGGAASIDFTSIPATYTDLLIKVSGRRSGTGIDQYQITFNGNGSNYSDREVYGSGSAAASGSRSAQSKIYVTGIDSASETTNTFGNTEIYIPNYTGSNNKSLSADSVTENNGTTAYAELTAGLWGNTAAITSISLGVTGSFVQYSTAYLYGIKNS